jgi:prolyl oligopeptidase
MNIFVTSTKDDRVHPSHAQKLAAKMLEYKNSIEYYEHINGGHSGSANIEESVHMKALEFTFLFQQLFDHTFNLSGGNVLSVKVI